MNAQWEPRYADFDERPVEMSCETIMPNAAGGNDTGVVVQQPVEKYAGDGALFWIDAQHMYLRYSWNLWYPVSASDEGLCRAICRRHMATLTLYDGANVLRYPLRVFHIDRLPPHLFEERHCDTAEPAAANDADVETERKLLAGKVESRGGSCIASAKPGEFAADVYELKGHIICAVFFRPGGDWLADETAFADDWPIWFGESAQEVSPVAAAAALREKVMHALPEVPVASFAVLKMRCTVINERDMHEIWDDVEDVVIVRNVPVDDSTVACADDALDIIHGESDPGLRAHADRLAKILSDFNPLLKYA